MVSVEISDETYELIKSFKKVIDAVMEEKMEKMDDYISLILRVGMTKMLMDVVPDDELLRMTILAMFKDNPHYLCDFVAKILSSEEHNVRKPKEEWMVAYR